MIANSNKHNDKHLNDYLWAVIVTFHPERELLSNLINQLYPQVIGIIIVNNGNTLPDFFDNEKKCQINHLGNNFGIATALNIGIDMASENGASHIILFDQDSHPAIDMVERLYASFLKLQQQGYRIAALGPRHIDRRTGKAAPALAADTQECAKMLPAPYKGYLEVDMIITSGSMISVKALCSIGMMREELFIDHVDMEWCFRARHKGYQTFMIADASMTHSIGDNIFKFFNREVIVHSPIRHYYRFRNSIALIKSGHMTKKWKKNISTSLIRQFFFYSIFLPHRRERIKLMLRGASDGYKGALGNYTSIHGEK